MKAINLVEGKQYELYFKNELEEVITCLEVKESGNNVFAVEGSVCVDGYSLTKTDQTVINFSNLNDNYTMLEKK